jgi:hypothetical protein
MVGDVPKNIVHGRSGRQERSPSVLFDQIRERFARWGALGNQFVIEHEGCRYRVSCDDHAFLVYRVNTESGMRHHIPGWPVCLVNSDTIFEELRSDALGQDHCSCGVALDTWLEIIDRLWRSSSGTVSE